jgi:Uma2 family endonuclease
MDRPALREKSQNQCCHRGEGKWFNHQMPANTRLTYEDFCRLPDDGKQYEIIEGELYVAPAPPILHQIIVFRLLSALSTSAQRQGLGQVLIVPVDVVFSDFDVVEPDILYISKQRPQC